jgi:hypothetical protein
MLKFLICVLIYLYLPSVNASENANQVIDFLKTACASGEKVVIKNEGDGSFSLKRGGIKGHISYSKSDFRGIAEGLSSTDQAKNLQSVRDCMNPHIKTIIDSMLSGN